MATDLNELKQNLQYSIENTNSELKEILSQKQDLIKTIMSQEQDLMQENKRQINKRIKEYEQMLEEIEMAEREALEKMKQEERLNELDNVLGKKNLDEDNLDEDDLDEDDLDEDDLDEDDLDEDDLDEDDLDEDDLDEDDLDEDKKDKNDLDKEKSGKNKSGDGDSDKDKTDQQDNNNSGASDGEGTADNVYNDESWEDSLNQKRQKDEDGTKRENQSAGASDGEGTADNVYNDESWENSLNQRQPQEVKSSEQGNYKNANQHKTLNSATESGAQAGAEASASTEASASAGASASASTGASAGASAGAGAAVAGTPVGWIILIIIAVIIILILLIGFISFFITMPGSVKEKLHEFTDKFWTSVLSGFVGIAQAQAKVEDEVMVELAQYLEDMGYDLEGYGLVEKITRNGEEGGTTSKYEDSTGAAEEKITDENGISKVKSKYLLSYIASDNRSYVISNTDRNLKNIFSTMWQELLGEDVDHIADGGNGLIVIAGEEGVALTTGQKNTYGTEKLSVTVDRENKLLVIDATGQSMGSKTNTIYTYNLEGWIGKYGMPIEYLLALHLGTLAPDFAYGVATTREIQAHVYIQLHEMTATHTIVCRELTSTGYWTGNYIPVADILNMEESEREIYGITEENIDSITKLIYAYETNQAKAYIPYISQVTNHWYRNLDFSECYGLYSEPTIKRTQVEGDYGNITLFIEEVVENGGIVQLKEPEQIDNSKVIRSLIEDYEYTIYDGTIKEKKERPKQKITPTTTMSTALAMLEAMEGEDAEHITRDLKELMKDYGFTFDDPFIVTKGANGLKTEEEDNKEYQEKYNLQDDVYDEYGKWIKEEAGLTTVVPGATNIVAEGMRLVYKAKTANNTGFSKGETVVAPVTGTIIGMTQYEEGDEIIGNVRIQTDNGTIVGVYGFIVDTMLENDMAIVAGEQIGKTSDIDVRIVVIKPDKTVANPEDYSGETDGLEGANLDAGDEELIARIIEGETSGRHSYKELVGIGAAVLNRIQTTNPSFKNQKTVKAIIEKKQVATSKMNVPYESISNNSKEAAKAAVAGSDPTNGLIQYIKGKKGLSYETTGALWFNHNSSETNTFKRWQEGYYDDWINNKVAIYLYNASEYSEQGTLFYSIYKPWANGYKTFGSWAY